MNRRPMPAISTVPKDRASTSRFRVTRTFVTVVEADKPFAALDLVRADPDAYDTDIIEHVELLTDEVHP